MSIEGQPGAERSLGAYVRLLRDYPGWRILWIGEILSNLGNWFSYVATLLVVERLAQGRGVLLSIVLIMRFLPSFFLFPVAGVFADRYDRVWILIISCLVSAGAVALLPLIQQPKDLWLLYALLFLEFSTAAFYDPARRALTPSLVPRSMLHLATTLDSFAWSLMGAVGASVGGLAASRVGVEACFYLDATTYLVAAACSYKLKRLRSLEAGKGAPYSAVAQDQREEAAEAGNAAPPAPHYLSTAQAPEKVSGLSGRNAAVELPERRDDYKPATGSKPFLSDALSNRQSTTGEEVLQDEEAEALLRDRQNSSGKASTPAINTSIDPGNAPKGCIALALWGVRDEVHALKEGWQYIWSPSNRDVCALTLLKSSGALVWAAADVLNVRFSELPEMQKLGDAAFTLGLFFASVGFACFVGPVAFNFVTPPKPPHLLLSSASCFLFLMGGYLGIVVAGNVFTMSLSIMVRSFGSAVLWVYSTLLLQLRVPDQLLGRMMALEMAFLTVSECVSGMFGGIALDDLNLSVRQVGLIMATVAAVMSCVWLPYAVKRFRALRAPLPNQTHT